jgi:hypothetical protein
MTDKGNYSVAGNCKFRRWFNTIWQNSLIQKPVGQPTPGAPTADPRQNIRIIRTFDRQMRPANATGKERGQQVLAKRWNQSLELATRSPNGVRQSATAAVRTVRPAAPIRRSYSMSQTIRSVRQSGAIATTAG